MPLGLSIIAWSFLAAILLFLALVAAGYVFQLVRDAKRLARHVQDAADRLRVAGDDVRFEVERTRDQAEHIRALRKQVRRDRP